MLPKPTEKRILMPELIHYVGNLIFYLFFGLLVIFHLLLVILTDVVEIIDVVRGIYGEYSGRLVELAVLIEFIGLIMLGVKQVLEVGLTLIEC